MISQRCLSLTNAKKSSEQFALKFMWATYGSKTSKGFSYELLTKPRYLSKINLNYHVYVIDLSLNLSVFFFSFHLKIS